jgi:site-specific recombinase XerD
MRSHAKNIVSFLNYILENNDKLKLDSLYQLDFTHGTEYLNHLTTSGKERVTVKSAERSLTEFFIYLSKKGILNITVINLRRGHNSTTEI